MATVIQPGKGGSKSPVSVPIPWPHSQRKGTECSRGELEIKLHYVSITCKAQKASGPLLESAMSLRDELTAAGWHQDSCSSRLNCWAPRSLEGNGLIRERRVSKEAHKPASQFEVWVTSCLTLSVLAQQVPQCLHL